LGTDDQHSSVVVVLNTDARDKMSVEPLLRHVLGPHAREDVALVVAKVAAQVERLVEPIEIVHRQEIVAQKQLFRTPSAHRTREQ
jgi:hypothetical protein